MLLGALVAVMLLATAALRSPLRAATNAEVVRYAGVDRFDSAAQLSAGSFDPGVPVAFIATGEDFPDAVAVGAVAGALGAPVLLTARDALPSSTYDELGRLVPQTVVVIGGPGAVSDAVLVEIRNAADVEPDRISGPDRYATAVAITSAFVDAGAPVAYIATGEQFPDALSGGAAAAAEGGPMLLVPRTSIPTVVRDELERLAPADIVVLGGHAAVADEVVADLASFTAGSVTRRAGDDRYATAAAVADAAFPGMANEMVLATGQTYADAVAGAAAAGNLGVPLLLTTRDCVPATIVDTIERLNPETIFVLGGVAAISDAAARMESCSPSEVSVAVDVIQTGLTAPWDVTFTPDGRTFVTERDSGRLLERAADGTLTVRQVFDVDADGEGGLLGLETSPDYLVDGLLYTYITTAVDNRVLRFDPDTGAQATIVDGIEANTFHDAGRLEFGPDGMLYVGTGDAGVPQRSQDPASLAGKILRITPTGGAPADNPTPGSRVFASGLRDPQGLAFDAAGRLYASEFGPDRDDEINLVPAGGNHAWGSEPGGQSAQPTGVTGDPAFVDPILVRQPPDASWSGAAILRDGAIPQWEGDLFVAALRGQRLYRVDLDAEGTVRGVEELLVGTYGRLRHVTQALDGSLWVLTSNCDGRGSCGADRDRIIRLGPA